MRRLGVLLLISFSLATPPLFSANKSLDDYWKDVDMKFEMLTPYISTAACNHSEQFFLGCIQGINRLLATKERKLRLIPNTLLNTNPLYGKIIRDYGEAKIVEVIRIDIKSLQEMYKKTRANRKAEHAAWTKVFNPHNLLNTLFSEKNNFVASIKPFFALPFDDILAWTKKKVVTAENEYKLTPEALNGFLSAGFDPNTRVRPSKYIHESLLVGDEHYTGVGILITLYNRIARITKLLEGGTARDAGLKVGDIITHIDGNTVTWRNFLESTDMIQGTEGSVVRITVQRGEITKTLPITRTKIVRKKVSEDILLYPKFDDLNIGYIRLASFAYKEGVETPPCDEIIAAIKKQSENTEGLILDLRDNPGGLIEEALCITGLFVPARTPILAQISLDQTSIEAFAAPNNYKALDLPLVILQDAESRSAAEIVSGALQDLQRAWIVGERSFGKGSVQSIVEMPILGDVSILLTFALYHLPYGRTTQLHGVTPDFTVHKNPESTPDQRFSPREADAYPFPIPNPGPSWIQPRTKKVQELSDCITASGLAKKRFEDDIQNKPGILPDYQLYFAEDLIACLVIG